MKKLIAFCLLIIGTFSLFAQESIEVEWPSKWKVLTDQETDQLHQWEYIPKKENGDNWTVLGTVMKVKGVPNVSMDVAKNLLTEQVSAKTSNAKITELDRKEQSVNPWILLQVDNSGWEGPESQLYFITQGSEGLYMVFVAQKTRKLKKDFVEEWSSILKRSKLVGG